MRTSLRISALLLASASAACGGSAPTGPSSDTAAVTSATRTRVERTEIVLATVGEAAALTASDGSRSTDAPSLALASEARWLHDAPVLDAAELAAGRVRAAAPGTAVLDVAAFGAAPARVTVHVRPARPLVLSATATATSAADGDAVVLRGYRLDALAGKTVRVGETTATVLGGDSATLRLTVPAVETAACVSGAVRSAVQADGADVAAGVSISRSRRGELALSVGVPVRLTAAQARCLRLAPTAGARYALAFLDARLVRRAETGYEGSAPSPTYTATVAEAGQAAPPAFGRAPAANRTAHIDHVMRPALSTATAAGAPTVRSRPWTEGERFHLRDASLAAPLPVRVVKVYGGHLVLAVAEGEEPEGGMAAWTARADSAFEMAVRHAYPLLRATLSASAPVTSAGSGQLLVVARRESSPYLGSSVTTVAGGRRVSYAFVNTAYAFTAAGLLRTLTHEVAHAWQEEHAGAQGLAGTGAAAWALEGTADLLAWAALGRALGVGMLGNYDWAARLGDPGQGSYALLAAGTRGDLTGGYASAAGFLQDVAQRMVRRGASEDEALAAVTRGALEGWHGWDRQGGRRAGLADRVRARLGGGWEPADALLVWTLSQAADDLTASADLQNHAFARVSTAGRESGTGWLAPAVLRSGAQAVRDDPAAPASIAGNAATLTWRYGSPNYVRIEDDGFGGAYVLSAAAGGAPLEEAEWMIVRYR